MRTSRARRSSRPAPLLGRSTLAAVAVAVTIAAMAGGLAGCASAQPAGGTERTSTADPSGGPAESPTQEPPQDPTDPQGVACVDWVSFATPVEAASDAGAVLRGTVVEQDGTVAMYGVESQRWLVDVEEVLERPDPPSGRPQTQPELDVSPGERIAVVSTPQTCSSEAYPEGDPLGPDSGLAGADGTVIVLLSAASGEDTGEDSGEDAVGYHLITPYQGVITPAPGGGVPEEWPAP